MDNMKERTRLAELIAKQERIEDTPSLLPFYYEIISDDIVLLTREINGERDPKKKHFLYDMLIEDIRKLPQDWRDTVIPTVHAAGIADKEKIERDLARTMPEAPGSDISRFQDFEKSLQQGK